MQLILMVVFGIIVGVIAKFLMPGKDPGGWIITALLGIGGSVVGGYLFGVLGLSSGGPAGLIGSVVGACALLGVYRVMK